MGQVRNNIDEIKNEITLLQDSYLHQNTMEKPKPVFKIHPPELPQSNEVAYIQYWTEVKEILNALKDLDSEKSLFGSKGHGYIFEEPLTEQVIQDIESKYAVTLPMQYRTFLLTCGKAGPGPDYGIYNIISNLGYSHLHQEWPYTENFIYEDDIEDDHIIWDLPGLLFIGEAGCGTDYLLEINGKNPGTIWVNWTDECTRLQDFIPWYHNWLTAVVYGLQGLQRFRNLQKSMTLTEALEHMKCDYFVYEDDDNTHKTIRFIYTPGYIKIDKEEKIIEVWKDGYFKAEMLHVTKYDEKNRVRYKS